MSNNNHKNSSCAYAEQMVSYLYGEADAREKSNFETHLDNCPACTDELAAFVLVRSTVLDWRAEEFSTLLTPAFDILAAEYKESFSTTVVLAESRSWLAGFRQMFSLNSMKATAAFGILIICAGIVWFAFNFSGGNDNAENRDDVKSIEAAVTPTVELAKKSEEKSVADKNDEKSSPLYQITNSTPPLKREKPGSPNKSIIRASSNAPKNNSDNSIRNPKEASEDSKKTASVRKKRIPDLNDVEDEEDETIRLSDLFDELDTK